NGNQQTSLTILGCSSGDPQPGRATSGYLVQTGESLSLLDCGSGIVASFLKHGFDPLKLDRIFISHAHSDHLADLTLMIQKIYLTRRANPLTVYLPQELLEPFRGWLRTVYLFTEKFSFELKTVGYTDGMVYVGDFHLNAIANSHLAPAKETILELGLANRMQCFSFSLDFGDNRLLYSADLGSFDDISREIDSHSHLIVESTHIDLDEFFATAARFPATQFVLTHLGTEKAIAFLQQRIEAGGSANIRLAAEGMRIPL
ncbi:MAG: MBL fold metallo-hydrolase, partial [Candidatus Zixiibacteriota bacterium]